MANFYAYSDLKTLAANLTGRTDGSTANTLRDNFINFVIRDIVDYFPFSWARRTTTVVLNVNGSADLPANFNPLHGVFDLREVLSGTNNDHVYSQVGTDILDATQATDYAYSIDFDTSSTTYKVNTIQTNSPTLTMVYYHYPADLSGASDVTVIPDPQCIGYFVGAKLWLTKERDETNHDRYHKIAMERLQMMVAKDNVAAPIPTQGSILDSSDFGFNRGSSAGTLAGQFNSK